jgi:hypothetical protein
MYAILGRDRRCIDICTRPEKWFWTLRSQILGFNAKTGSMQGRLPTCNSRHGDDSLSGLLGDADLFLLDFKSYVFDKERSQLRRQSQVMREGKASRRPKTTSKTSLLHDSMHMKEGPSSRNSSHSEPEVCPTYLHDKTAWEFGNSRPRSNSRTCGSQGLTRGASLEHHSLLILLQLLVIPPSFSPTRAAPRRVKSSRALPNGMRPRIFST